MVVGKDSLRIIDNSTRIEEDVIFFKNEYGEWVPGKGSEWLAFEEVGRLVRYAYMEVFY